MSLQDIINFFNATIDNFDTTRRLVIDFYNFNQNIINELLELIKPHYDVIKSHQDLKVYILFPRHVKISQNIKNS